MLEIKNCYYELQPGRISTFSGDSLPIDYASITSWMDENEVDAKHRLAFRSAVMTCSAIVIKQDMANKKAKETMSKKSQLSKIQRKTPN